MPRADKKCPVCKKDGLKYTAKEVKCTECNFYNQELSFAQRVEQWTYEQDGGGRAIIYGLAVLYSIMVISQMSGAISSVLNYTAPSASGILIPINAINLGIHEIGHGLFGFFGETIAIAGGSMMEIFFGLLLIAGFLQIRYYFASALAFIHLGYAIMSVGVYTADAQPRVLNIVAFTFDKEALANAHDWHNLLTKYDILSWHDELANIMRFTGIGFIILGLVISGILLRLLFVNMSEDRKEDNSEKIAEILG